MRLLVGLFLVFLSIASFAQPKAKFGANATQGCGFLQVVFIDSSSANIVAWKWDLGNGITSDKQNPGRIFDKPGAYKICLTVTDNNGKTDTKCVDNFINVFAKPEPNFLIDINKGCSPVNVNFKDLSKSANGEIVNWIWDIGGSANLISTTDKSLPIKSTYTQSGLYSMTLTVKDNKGCEASIGKKDLLQVIKNPAITLQKKFLNSCELPWEVDLENVTSDNSTKYTWILGNGVEFIGIKPPIVSFSQKGNYTLKIITQKGECIDTTVYENYVNTNPKKEIGIEKQNFCLGDEVAFTDKSELGADSVKWTFGDGFFSSEKSPKHTYLLPGCFKISLLRFRGNCYDTVVYNCVNIIKTSKPDYTIDNQFTCTVPVTINAKGVSTGTYKWNLIGLSYDELQTNKNSSFNVNKFGNYTMKLVYTSNAGCSYIDSLEVAIKKFEANLPGAFLGGCVPYDVDLGDSVITEIPITKYEWSVATNPPFKSTLKKPKFNLKDIGQFDVNLIVTNLYGCKDTVSRPGYVQGGTPPNVDFLVAPIDECLNVERTFNDKSSANANFWSWDFGDKSTALGSTVKHLYNMPGTYDVSLVAMHNSCAAVKIIPQLIKVKLPVSNYEIKYQCDNPYTILLNNLTLGGDSLYWSIFNGTKRDTIRDSLLNKFTFPGRGKYTLEMYSKNFDSGCEHNRLDTIIITDPIAKYIVDTLKGCVPLTINVSNLSIDADSIEYKYNNLVLANNKLTYDKGGQYQLPTLYVKDIHGCEDSLTLPDKVFVNAIQAKGKYDDIICIPQSTLISSVSKDSFAEINSYKWFLGQDTFFKDSILFEPKVASDYDLKLVVKDEWSCSDSITIKAAIQAILLKPDFTSDSLGCTNLEMLFAPSGDNINTKKYLWEFSDGTIDSVAFPKHKFSDEGAYNVCLTLFDARGCKNTICKDDWVKINDPKADFNGDVLTETCPPLLTHFTNKSSNAISYQWDFGDKSGISFTKDPAHIYLDPDSFDVSLIAIRSNSCRDTLLLKDYIRVLGPRGTFDYKIEGNCTPLKVVFSASTDDYYRYFWDFGNGVIDSSLVLQLKDDKTYSYNSPGVYNPKLVVTDQFGCKRNFTQKPIIVDEIKLDVKIDDNTLCGLPAFPKIINNSTSSTEATYFEWQLINGVDTIIFFDKDISPVLNNFGDYKINLISNADNCIVSLTNPLDISVSPAPVADFTYSNILCQYNKIDAKSSSVIQNGTIQKYNWSVDGKTYSTKDISFLPTQSGDQILQLIVESDKKCTDTISKTINIIPNTKLTPLNDTIICIGESFLLNSNVIAQNNATYTWYENNNKLCSNCPSKLINPNNKAQYIFEAITDMGCVVSDTMVVDIAPVPPPMIDIGKDSTYCKGIKSQLNINNFDNTYTYTWLGSSPSQCEDNCKKLNVVLNSDTTFIAKVTNKYGCRDFDTINIFIENINPDFLINEKFICENANTLLSIKDWNVIKWLDGNNTICNNCNEVSVNPKNDQYFKAIVKSKNQCLYADSIFIKHVSLQSVKVGNDVQVCLGEKVTLSSEGIGNAVWTYNTTVLGNESVVQADPQISGNYLVTYTKDECIIKDSINIEVLTKANITAIGDTICFGDTINVVADGLAEIYEWYINNESVSSEKNYSYSPKLSENLTVIGKRTTCISDTVTVNALVHPFIDYTIEKESYSIYLNTKQVIESIGSNTNNYTYLWSPPFGLNCTTCPNPTIENLQNTTTFFVEITDPNTGCVKEQSIIANLFKECSNSGFIIPNVFKIGSGANGVFKVTSFQPESFVNITVKDRWGNFVFQSNDINNSWDGTFNGCLLEEGVYTYLLNAICLANGEKFQYYGDVTLLK